MIKKLRKIALVLSIAAVLFATGPEVAQVWFQAANANNAYYLRSPLIVNKAILLFGVNLPPGRESPTFIQNVTQLAKEGFDSPENAKLFLQLDSITLNASSSHPGLPLLTLFELPNCSMARIVPPFRQLYQETISDLPELKAALVDLGHKSAFDLLLKE